METITNQDSLNGGLRISPMAQDTEQLGYNEENLDGSEGEDGRNEGSYEMKSDRNSECDSLSDEGSYSPSKAEVELNQEVTLEQGKFRKLDASDGLENGARLNLDEEDEIDVGSNDENHSTEDEDEGRAVNGEEGVLADNEQGDDSASEIGSYHVNTDKEDTGDEHSHQSDAEYDLDSNESSGEEDTMDEVELIRMRELKRQDNPDLPETVTKLVTPTGCQVYIVGTAHFSDKSQDDVAKTIHAVQPDVVVLELCKSRLSILSLDEETLLKEAQNLNIAKLRQSVQQSGVIGGVMQVLLLSMSAHLTKELGMAPGGEFRRAFKEAQTIPGCRVHLGDRPIQITLKRAMSSLSVWQKLRLAWYLLTSKDSITADDVERYKQKDLLEEMLGEMTGEFPGLSDVFVTERDLFLAQSLKLCAQPVPQPDSRTGYYLPVVVGIVGMGHVPGIVSNWTKECTREDIAAIVSVPPPSRSAQLFKYGLRGSVLGIFIWGCVKCCRWWGLSLW